jgi:hypothetical protein
MLSVAISLDRIYCHRMNIAGNPESVNPYLWTVFFYADINTIKMGFNTQKIVVTETPGSNFTTREMYPDNVSAGDEIEIPWSLGKHRFILDDGGTGKAAVGALFVLLSQRQTPGDAISAGHRALAEATNAVLNNYVWTKLPDVPAPTPADIQQMADQIQGEVHGAVKDALSWYDILLEQDGVLGFSHIFMSYAELSALAARQPPVRLGIFNWIGRRFKVSIDPFNQSQEIEIDYAFRIAGGVSAAEYTPPSVFQRELDSYNDAVDALKATDGKINQVREELRDKSGDERVALLAVMDELQTVVRPQAVEALGMARAVYDQRRDSISTTSRDYLAAQEALQKAREDRLARQGTSQFHEQAVIGSIEDPEAASQQPA